MYKKPKPHSSPAQSSKAFMVVGLFMLAILIGGMALLIVSIVSTQAPELHELTATIPIATNPAIIEFGQQTATAAVETEAARALATEQSGRQD